MKGIRLKPVHQAIFFTDQGIAVSQAGEQLLVTIEIATLQFSQQLANAQAAQFAVNVQASAVSDGIVQLTLDGIGSLTDLVAVQKVFGTMLTVRQQQLVEFLPGQATIRLTLAASEADFYRALTLVKQLQPVFPNAPVSMDPTADPAAINAEVATNGQAVTQDQSSGDPATAQEATPAISAAEQALEAALSSDGAPATDVPEQSAAVTLPVIQAEVIVPLGHRHFRFVRP
mgnify:CR=1 FL=1